MTPLAVAPAADWRLGVVLAVLVLVAATTSVVARFGVEREQVVAAVRAVAQLAVVAAVIVGVLASVPLSLLFLAVMYVVAAVTAWRRLRCSTGSLGWVLAAIGSGAGPVVAICLASGVVPLAGAALIPVAGIVIGNTMTAVTLTGRRAFDELRQRHGEVEAALALGFPDPMARDLVVRHVAREGLLPALDQTRTVGLVTLPGAFVGVILGGGSPVQAGAAQVLVLVGILAAQALTAAVTLWAITTARVVRQQHRSAPRSS
jgi:putative ABC transport system permease protein